MITPCGLRDLLQQLARAATLALAHSGAGSFEQEQMMVLHQKHADLDIAVARGEHGGPAGGRDRSALFFRACGDLVVDTSSAPQ